MHIPIWSVVTLAAELLITAAVYITIIKAYRTGVFLRRLAFGVLVYETIFNITYMLSREISSTSAAVYSPYETGLAIFHGIFSIIMFITLIFFFIAADRGYTRGENYFSARPRLVAAFAIAWAISILSGVTFFVSLYII